MGICNSSTKKKENIKPTNNINKLNTEDKTILGLKTCRDNIKSYIKRLDMNEAKQKQKAKEELKRKDREKAKMFIKQAKLYKEQSNAASGQLAMIEEQVSRINMAKG